MERGTAQALQEQYPDIPLYPSSEPEKVKLAAAWLIDRAGWKGAKLGRVGVHDRQALVLINLGGATGGEVIDLARKIIDSVHSRFGVSLETEVNIL